MWLILSLRGRFLFLMGVYLISYYMKKYVVCWYAALDADLIGGLVGRCWLQLGTCQMYVRIGLTTRARSTAEDRLLVPKLDSQLYLIRIKS